MKRYILIILLFLFCGGCGLFQSNNYINIPEFNVISDIQKSKDIVEKSSVIIKKETNNIRNEKNSISTITSIEKIDRAVVDLNSAINLLDNAEDKVNTIETILKKTTKERDAAVKEKNDQMQKLFRWIILGCIVGFGASVAIIMMGSTKMGITGIAASLSTLLLAITITQHIVLITWVGVGILGLIFLFLLYEGWNCR